MDRSREKWYRIHPRVLGGYEKKKKDVQRLPPVNRPELVDFVRWKTFFRSLFYILSF